MHARECAERCAADCPVVGYEGWLDSPVTATETAAEKLREERLQALMRGEIPA